MPTVQQLRKLAQARKVPKYSSMTKPQLLGALGMHDDLKAHKLSQGQTKAVSANAKNIAKGNATARAIVEGRLKRAVARDLKAAKKGGKELSQEEKREIALKAVAREAKAIKAGQKEEKPKRGGDAASRILSKLKSGEAVHYTGLDGHEYEAKYERNDDLGVASLSIGRPGDRRPRRQPIMHDRDLHQFASDLVNPKLNQIASQAKAIKAGQKEENPERGGVQKKQAIEEKISDRDLMQMEPLQVLHQYGKGSEEVQRFRDLSAKQFNEDYQSRYGEAPRQEGKASEPKRERRKPKPQAEADLSGLTEAQANHVKNGTRSEKLQTMRNMGLTAHKSKDLDAVLASAFRDLNEQKAKRRSKR